MKSTVIHVRFIMGRTSKIALNAYIQSWRDPSALVWSNMSYQVATSLDADGEIVFIQLKITSCSVPDREVKSLDESSQELVHFGPGQAVW